MNEPAASRPQGWPLVAISLLVLLLSGFLYLRWRKREEAPVIVKEPPKVVEPVAVTPPPPPPAPDFQLKLQEYRKAFEGKRWDDALAALAAARALKPEAPELAGAEEAVAEARKKEEAERAEAARLAEMKRKQSAAWAIVKEKVEKSSAQDFWDAALAALEGFAKEYPEAPRDTDYSQSLGRVKGFQAEADKFFTRDMKDALAHFAEGRYGQAIAQSENALKFYPERQERVREFQSRAREMQSEKTMVRIPSSLCWIGGEDHPDERPLRQQRLPAFLIDRYEVTNEDYYAFIAATGAAAPPHWTGRRIPKGRERHPVVLVSWDDAAAYAKWAGKRLPSSEEWEVAARGPDKREFPWGNVFLEKEDKFPCNSLEYWQFNKTEAPGTTLVDRFDTANGESAFGVYGMAGNVWEWTSTSAPAQGQKPPPEFRILKGGSFMTPQRALRCANVYPEDPRLAHPDVGFRCARDLK